jgi:hypothetical protein
MTALLIVLPAVSFLLAFTLTYRAQVRRLERELTRLRLGAPGQPIYELVRREFYPSESA